MSKIKKIVISLAVFAAVCYLGNEDFKDAKAYESKRCAIMGVCK